MPVEEVHYFGPQTRTAGSDGDGSGDSDDISGGQREDRIRRYVIREARHGITRATVWAASPGHALDLFAEQHGADADELDELIAVAP